MSSNGSLGLIKVIKEHFETLKEKQSDSIYDTKLSSLQMIEFAIVNLIIHLKNLHIICKNIIYDCVKKDSIHVVYKKIK